MRALDATQAPWLIAAPHLGPDRGKASGREGEKHETGANPDASKLQRRQGGVGCIRQCMPPDPPLPLRVPWSRPQQCPG